MDCSAGPEMMSGVRALVDEDAVDLVDDGEVVPALHEPRDLELHVVAQVVESELVVGPVGDVAGVGRLALGVLHVVLDDAHRHAQEAIDAPHPLRVAPGQVVVDGHHVNALAAQRVEIRGQSRDERLALTGLHLGDGAAVQDHAPDELHVEMPHLQRAPACLTNDRERLDQQIVERLPARNALPEVDGPGPQLVVGEGLHVGLERIDVRHARLQALQQALILGAEDFLENGLEHHAGTGRWTLAEGGMRWDWASARIRRF